MSEPTDPRDTDPSDPRRHDGPAPLPSWERPGPSGYGAGIGGRRPPGPRALLVALLVTLVALPLAAWLLAGR